ncbi:MAG: DUF5610 domain-containing protein [Magnetococcales bacterium]|nr:DUF5610 domain-containing protein [Magnetococcales bacterium]
MMIQSVSALQSYNLIANSSANGAKLAKRGVSGEEKTSENSNPLDGENVRSSSDFFSFSSGGVTAYANQALKEKALTEINRMLQESDPNAKAVEDLDPEDHTPLKTAEYIVSVSTGFFDKYAESHPELEQQGLLDGFIDLISGGIKRGLEEAKDILEGLDVLNGHVKEGIDTTDTLIWEKLKLYYEEKQSNFTKTNEVEEEYAAAA